MQIQSREPEADGFIAVAAHVREALLDHPAIADNAYCNWFAEGELTREDVRVFTRQFSVFSNQFLLAQTRKMINAGDLGEMRQAKEILANEIGVVFRGKGPVASDLDPQIVGTEGSVDGGSFRFRAAHYEWLLQFAAPLGLGFADMGRRSHGLPSTLRFCDELMRLYGSEDHSTGAGASFAVENWAAAGFWKQLIAGLERFCKRSGTDLNIGFFRWHDRIEDQHAAHTMEELRSLWQGDLPLDIEAFVAAGRAMLDGVAVFWDGLDEERRSRRAAS